MFFTNKTKLLLVLLLLILSAGGCVPSQGPSDEGSEEVTQPELQTSGYLGEWTFVSDNGHAVYSVNIVDYDEEPRHAGSDVALSMLYIRADGAAELMEHDSVRSPTGYMYYTGWLSADGTVMHGTYGGAFGGVQGMWCAARKGAPYITDRDFVGVWDLTTLDNTTGEHTFVWELGTASRFIRNTDAYYPGNTTSLILTGGLTFRVEQKSTSGASAGTSVFTGVRESPTVLSGTYSRQILNGTLTGEWFADKMVPGNG